MFREEDNRYKTLSVFDVAYDKVAEGEIPVGSDVRKAIKTIADAVNRESPKAVGEIMAVELVNQHRTLQACTVRAILSMLEAYQGASYDLRNKAAVEAAEKISNMEDMYIPFI